MTTTTKSPKSPRQTIKCSANSNKKFSMHSFPLGERHWLLNKNSFGCSFTALSKLFNTDRAVLQINVTLMKTLPQRTCMCLPWQASSFIPCWKCYHGVFLSSYLPPALVGCALVDSKNHEFTSSWHICTAHEFSLALIFDWDTWALLLPLLKHSKYPPKKKASSFQDYRHSKQLRLWIQSCLLLLSSLDVRGNNINLYMQYYTLGLPKKFSSFFQDAIP